MHLIVVRRDTTGFQHVHPEMARRRHLDGPADPAGRRLVPRLRRLRPDGRRGHHARRRPRRARHVRARGSTPRAAPRRSTATPSSSTGELVPGQASPVTLTVSKDGQPVTDLQPYLAAYGHLVALREGDLAYLHVHPEGSPATAARLPDRRSSSSPRCPVRAATGCSWTSSTTGSCARQSSPCPPARRVPDAAAEAPRRPRR